MRHLLTLALALALVACSSNKRPTDVPATSVDALLTKIRAAGLVASDLKPVSVDQLGAGKCRRGDVAGVELTACEYPDAAAAKKNEASGLELIGDNTGSSLSEGQLLLVVADRKNVDKEGKTIDTIMRALRGH